MKKYIRNSVLIFALLLLGGMANEAWAAEVRYHILTLPFNVQNGTNTGTYHSSIRVEALLVKSKATTVGLPDQYKSPLAKNFKYWRSWETTYGYLYDKPNQSKLVGVKYYLYSADGGGNSEIKEPAATSTEGITDIYVTYEYDNTKGYLLDNTKEYNISVGTRYLFLNRSRNNRLANANAAGVKGEHLASEEFVVPLTKNEDKNNVGNIGLNWTTDATSGEKGAHFGFWLEGQDPYNITLKTAYTGNEVYTRDKVYGDNEAYIKPYRGATLFSKIGTGGSENKMWFDCDNDVHYKGKNLATWETDKDTWPGYYRGNMAPLFNAVALLNHPKGGYVFVGSKLNQDNMNGTYTEYQPNGSGYYTTLTDGNDNPKMSFVALDKSPVINIYEIRTYTVKIKTHWSATVLSADMRWSDAMTSQSITDHLPDKLKRKYVSYKAYSDESLMNPITTFADASAGVLVDGKRVIWLDYTVSGLPFDTLTAEAGVYDFKKARWYTMRMNGGKEQQNIAYNSSNSLITGNASIGSSSNLHTGENSADAQVAFVGDPFELKIISRAASEAASPTPSNRYIGCATDATNGTTLSTDKTASSDIIKWEMVYETINLGEDGSFILRQFDTYDSPKYIGWDNTSTNHPVVYSTEAYTDKNRIRVVKLNQVPYTFYIMRNNATAISAVGNKAVKATVNLDVGTMLTTWQDIPDVIRSPFLKDATVTFYDSEEKSNVITNAPYSATGGKIYVGYTLALSGDTYNVILNNTYIYTSEDAINTQSSITGDNAANAYYRWTLDYSDPYSMTIKNVGKDKYVNIASWSNNEAIGWSDTPSYFIAKSGAQNNTYEVMAATGGGDGDPDASITYYNIGRPAENTVKLYDNSSTGYLQGNQVLRFQLIGVNASDITYHLIDMDGNDLIQAVTRQTTSEHPEFPPEYHSPLVSKYYYHSTLDHAKNNRTSGDISDNAAIGTGRYNIYVTYDVNDLVDLKRGKLYRLKYEAGQDFHQEDGSDGVNSTAEKAVYPYVNGDCNFFIYGEEQYDIQKYASSTRTRWVWYLQSDAAGRGDPYHVKIRSYQTESYPISDPRDYNAYFATYQPKGYDQVVTTLVWPGISGEAATEYMVLGSEGQYQLVTTYGIDKNLDGDRSDEGENVRYTVNSFEQYWKTFDTIRRKLYGDSKTKENDNDSITVPSTAKAKFGSSTVKTLRDSLTNDIGWHHYEHWAYAKRWNGYNNGYSSTEGKHETKKGWEEIEHWYQTIDMGQGYFDFVETTIDPVLILLDQHGWEIMRKPLPSGPDDPQKNAKYEAIRPYNSPLVKEYAFWATAKKRTNFHQYHGLNDRIGDNDFTSTDLTNLPPYGSKNVKDKRGNLNDQYVTYIVKDEYAQCYNPSTKTGVEFLIEQGSKYASATSSTTITKNNVPSGGMSAKIISGVADTDIWYIKPNEWIDYEMGYGDANHEWNAKNPNAYEHNEYKNAIAATYIDIKARIDSIGRFSFSNGFDPYNIQITPKNYTTSIRNNATGAVLDDGDLSGTYAGAAQVELSDTTGSNVAAIWYDSRRLRITNATWMAVQDAAGNMQLMPRFDHDLRMSEFGDLIAPSDANIAKSYTKFYSPRVYKYHIVDNSGQESIHYQSGGDLTPQLPDHLKSPFAKDFTFYKTLTLTSSSGRGTYNLSTLANPITESFAKAGLTAINNDVYIRYAYDEESDQEAVLKGKWFTMQMNEKDMLHYNNDIHYGKADSDATKPETVDADDGKWQWKFLATPQTQPDPYAVRIYNRAAGGQVGTDSYAILNHTSGGYVLAKNDSYNDYTPKWLQAKDYKNDDWNKAAANTATSTLMSGTGYDIKAQVKLLDDVTHTFTYKVYTNEGAFAIDADQSQYDVTVNDWKPELPESARTPLLDLEQYRYYEHTLANGSVAEADTLGKALSLLYGLYDDIVYTHYTPYNDLVTNYKVPNVRNDKGSGSDAVARLSDSNDAPIALDGKRLYNIIWLPDNMMKSNGIYIEYDADHDLTATAGYTWVFEGDDPYAIKIKGGGGSGKYIQQVTEGTTTELSDTPTTTFMLLNRDGYDYGVFAKTGNSRYQLSGCGNTLADTEATPTPETPTKFIIFALSTYKVIYHLMIKNIGKKVIIPYRGPNPSDVLNPQYVIKETGTTVRDLKSRDVTEGYHIDGDKYDLSGSLRAIGSRLGSPSSGLFKRDSIYCVDAGHISLGDSLQVPSKFYRPNVHYDFYIEGIYSQDGTSSITAMDNEYKGRKVTKMGEHSELLDKIVFVNIVYSFLGDLETNAGKGFVTDVSQNMWYTFETSGTTPKLAQNTGSLQTQSGYATHYTNDYLWSPVGDPYGFVMYNRYQYKNLGPSNFVMTTTSAPGNNVAIVMADTTGNSGRYVYELLATSTNNQGYFYVHPVVNNTGLQYYITDVDGAMKLTTTPTEWAFGLSEDVMRPYYQGAGYVGGLNAAGKTAYENAAKETKPLDRLMSMQDVVYNHDKADNDADNYIVHYKQGYYRLHNQPGSLGISTPRYASGYTHLIESTDYDNNSSVDADGDGNTSTDILPMHFYEQTEYSVEDPVFNDLGIAGTDFTESIATRGEIPLSTVTYDPASIFYFSGEAGPSPASTMQTQGLYVKGNKMQTESAGATLFNIIDIGGGVVALNNSINYLSYKQDGKKYELSYGPYANESARWCMQPVQKGTTAGNGEMELRVATHNGGDSHYYTTFCAPFDVLLTDAARDTAWVVPAGEWPTITPPATIGIMYPKKIGEYNTTGGYKGNSQFIPAGTPVIIRTRSTTGYVTLALPSTTPTSSVSCVFTGKYLEQMLPHGADYVYVFGLPYSGTFTPNASFSTNGLISASGQKPDKGVGFYKNVNLNREAGEFSSSWTRNNKYVLANKIYYRSPGGGGSSYAREKTRGVDFVPVIFGDEENTPEDPDIRQNEDHRVGDGCVYDLQGRKVATKQQVEDDTWRQFLRPGIYIINGKKIRL